MKDQEKIILVPNVSRRTFIKGLGALGAMGVLHGCASESVPESTATTLPDSGETVVETAVLHDLQPPPIEGEVFAGSAPHNCGGRCVTKAYVVDGVIKRFVTDERPDKNLVDGTGDDPQRRACLRCRSYKGRLYRSDRLTYPMKQTKERGDLDGFVRISWEEAYSEIAEKMLSIKEQYGPKAFYNHYGSGDGSVFPGYAATGRFVNLFGGAQEYRSDYSWPAVEHMSWFFIGQNYYFPSGNSQDDVTNAEVILAWSNNYSELIWGTNSAWYMQQAREMGAKIIAVEARQTNTVSGMADEFIPVIPGTDPALLLSLIYVMIEEELLDKDFVKKYVHGFYDDPTPTLYSAGVDSTKYKVPAGASLSAYVIGDNEALVDGTYIQGTSIYPEQISYNVNEDDELAGKTTPCYGQIAKTPEWAEKITGVKAETIRDLARTWATKKVTTWFGGGFQRCSESEQSPWLVMVVGAITGNFGEKGRNLAMHSDKEPVAFAGLPSVPNPVMMDLMGDLYDPSNLTAPDYTPFITRFTFPVFLWSDIAKYGGTGESEWNDGQVKRTKVGIKCLMNIAGNALLNQHGDCNKQVELLKDKSKIELITVIDQYLTPSAKYADYILPAACAWEKNSATTNWVVGGNVIYMNKAIEPPGEAKPDYDILVELATELGFGEEFSEGKTTEEWIRSQWEAGPYAERMSYDEWKKEGIISTYDESTPTLVQFEAFRADPAATPLITPSGKFECYSQALVEDYEARGYDNNDAEIALSGVLHDGSNVGRFVYPIPMYIPLLEGKHADGSQPDVTGAFKKGYTFLLQANHKPQRSHSTHNNNAYLNELYKRDKDGNPAYLDPKREMGFVWDDNVYEPIWINPADAVELGIEDGDRVLVFNDRGKAYASAKVTNRAQSGVVMLGQGAWYDPVDGIDRGSCANTLTRQRPSRICQGMTLGSDTLVAIEKA